MARTRISANASPPAEEHAPAIMERENLADMYENDLSMDFDSVLDAESEFDVEDDIAFLGEDYDVVDIDDVLDMCNVEKPFSE
ncbi:MAG: hypothetical protein MJE12_15875 [Alphaproteobacteria bacterium]|nr:hypothetical protein [Alphaproteobacteria bacterium]